MTETSKKEFWDLKSKDFFDVETRIKNEINSIRELQQNLQHNTRIISTAAHLKELLQQS